MNAKMESLQSEMVSLRGSQDIILQQIKRLSSLMASNTQPSSVSYGESKVSVCEQCGAFTKKADLMEKSFLIGRGNYAVQKLCKKCFYGKHKIKQTS